MKNIKSIVVGTDFSAVADHAFDEALDLAGLFGATVTLVHSCELPLYGIAEGMLAASAQMTAQLQSNANAQLLRTAESRNGLGIAVTPVLRMGAPWESINAVAQETGAGLIVAGTHGHGGLTRALLGSVAEKLVRSATLPVLITHGGE